MIKPLAIAGLCAVLAAPVFAQTKTHKKSGSPAPAANSSSVVWVQVGSDGRLVYKTDAHGNRIPDFSSVGYQGGAAIPLIDVKATVEPARGDAAARIQAAIDEVSKLPLDEHGFRGTVLLRKGRYEIAGTLHILHGGIVLRGEGDQEGGTLLVATGRKKRSLVVVGNGHGKPADEDEETPGEAAAQGEKSRRAITDEYVPVGARSFHVDSAEGLKAGEQIVVKRPSTAAWIHAIGMDRIPPAKDHPVVQWKPGSKDLDFHRIITRIEGNMVTVDAPICCALERRYGGGLVLTGLPDTTTKHVGIESLRGDSEYHGNEDEQHGWELITLAAAENAWVRNVTSIHFGYSCVDVGRGSRRVTVEHCNCLDPISKIIGGRRYSFALDGELTLVEHCYAREGRHDFVMHALAAGPNVFYDCKAERAHADSGPHHRWSAGVLYDNVSVSGGSGKSSGVGINIRNRGNSGTGHGWAGANQVLWNCRADEIICEQPPTAQNWAIGCQAKKHTGDAYWESFDRHVQPPSLYQAQVRERP